MLYFVRGLLMLAALAAGYAWLKPRTHLEFTGDLRFVDQAQSAGCANTHTKVRLADEFANIMPWLASVGAAAAAADYNGDGAADLYVTNSGRGDANRLFRNRGDGTFEDVTASAGVGCGNPEGASMHAIWGDIDNDGHRDLYVIKWGEANTLFRNNGDGTFTDVSREAGVDYWGYGNGATFFDYDRDGRLDLFVANYFAETVTDPRTGQKVRNNLWHPVTTRVMHETFTHARNGGRNVLYRNLGDGRFEDVTESVGMNTTLWSLAVGAGDLNNDGWPDLYIANDFGPDELYVSTGATEQPPRFRLVVDPRGHPGVGNDWWKGMNVDFGDVNNDGYLDIYVTNVLSRRYKTDEGNMLWLNRPDALFPGGRGFRNAGEECNVHDGGWGWGGKFADFNNDGLLDIFTVDGFVSGDAANHYWYQIQEMVTQTKNQTVDAAAWPPMGERDLSGHERSRLFLQVASGGAGDTAHPSPRFVEAAEAAGIADTYDGRGIALADFNLDGRVDMYVANQGAPACYYVSQPVPQAKDRGFLRLTLAGRPDAGITMGDRVLASTADAVGARAVLHSARGDQLREVQGGMGFAAQSEYALHFGAPDPAAVTGLTIRWPSGRVQEFSAAQARKMIGRHVRIVEAEPYVSGGSK